MHFLNVKKTLFPYNFRGKMYQGMRWCCNLAVLIYSFKKYMLYIYNVMGPGLGQIITTRYKMRYSTYQIRTLTLDTQYDSIIFYYPHPKLSSEHN